MVSNLRKNFFVLPGTKNLQWLPYYSCKVYWLLGFRQQNPKPVSCSKRLVLLWLTTVVNLELKRTPMSKYLYIFQTGQKFNIMYLIMSLVIELFNTEKTLSPSLQILLKFPSKISISISDSFLHDFEVIHL